MGIFRSCIQTPRQIHIKFAISVFGTRVERRMCKEFYFPPVSKWEFPHVLWVFIAVTVKRILMKFVFTASLKVTITAIFCVNKLYLLEFCSFWTLCCGFFNTKAIGIVK